MLREAKTPRCWALPPTSVSEEVAHYSSRQKELGVKGARPRLRSDISDRHAEEQALKIDAALNFAELGERADPLVKPILCIMPVCTCVVCIVVLFSNGMATHSATG